MFAPAGTPRETVEKVAADVKQVLLLPQSRQKLAQEGAEPEPNSPEAFTAFVNADIAKWLELAHKAGIKLAN
jgi:tripartite-type tricarboxylate transporter receptor subunit TctC